MSAQQRLVGVVHYGILITVGAKLKVARETAITSAQKAYNTHPQCIVSAHTSTQPQQLRAHRKRTTRTHNALCQPTLRRSDSRHTNRARRNSSQLVGGGNAVHWRSPRGHRMGRTENLAGPEPLASSATAADALAATCLCAGALLRARRREHATRVREAWSGGAGAAAGAGTRRAGASPPPSTPPSSRATTPPTQI
jgi:hypothetical protein